MYIFNAVYIDGIPYYNSRAYIAGEDIPTTGIKKGDLMEFALSPAGRGLQPNENYKGGIVIYYKGNYYIGRMINGLTKGSYINFDDKKKSILIDGTHGQPQIIGRVYKVKGVKE